MTSLGNMPGHTRLYRRGAVYYHRAAVPKDIVETYPKAEETFSLKTKDHAEALRRVRIEAVRVDDKFEAHRRRLEAQNGPCVEHLLSNLGGDTALAGEVLHNLVYLIAEVSPGAKLGSTAPYSRAALMLLEAGERQPRSLAEAFRAPCPPETGQAVAALSEHLAALDAAYATGETRRVMTLANRDVPGAERGSLGDLAEFARDLPARFGGTAAA